MADGRGAEPVRGPEGGEDDGGAGEEHGGQGGGQVREYQGRHRGHGHVRAVPQDQAGAAQGKEEGAGDADCAENGFNTRGGGYQDEREGCENAGTSTIKETGTEDQ